jgi:hypothetical protein
MEKKLNEFEIKKIENYLISRFKSEFGDVKKSEYDIGFNGENMIKNTYSVNPKNTLNETINNEHKNIIRLLISDYDLPHDLAESYATEIITKVLSEEIKDQKSMAENAYKTDVTKRKLLAGGFIGFLAFIFSNIILANIVDFSTNFHPLSFIIGPIFALIAYNITASNI